MKTAGRVTKDELVCELAQRLGLTEDLASKSLDALCRLLREHLRQGNTVQLDDLLSLSVSGAAEIREDESGGFSAYAPSKKGIEVTPLGSFRQDLQASCRSTIYYASREDGAFTQLLADHFGRRGWTLMRTKSALEVLSRLESQPPVAVVFESHVEGWRDLLRELKGDPRSNGVPVVGIFPEGAPARAVPCLQVEPDEVICEPFDFTDFIRSAGAELATRVASPKGDAVELQISLPGTRRDIAEARALVEEVLFRSGLPETFNRDAGAALWEALDNAARHGHRSVECCTIGLRMILDPKRLVLSVRDSGDGFDHTAALGAARTRRRSGDTSTSAPLLRAAEALRTRAGEEREGGLARILKMVDRVEFNRPGNQVALTKMRPRFAAASTERTNGKATPKQAPQPPFPKAPDTQD